MSTQSALLLLTTETPLHAGAGQSVAGIDLPIQREKHTDWPCVYGSAVKGALRAHAELRSSLEKTDLTDLFGPDHGAAAGERDSSHAGALLIGDASLLALPVRSLQSAFKWVTCAQAVERFARTAQRLGLVVQLPSLPTAQEMNAYGTQEGALFLEEFRLAQQKHDGITQLAASIASLSGGALDAATVAQRLVLVSDDVFSFLVRNATAVNAHIAIDAQTKTVKAGALWYEETLPPETVLYVPVTATASRRKGSDLQALHTLEKFSSLVPAGKNWLQLGGNETTGMGWCRVGINAANGTYTAKEA